MNQDINGFERHESPKVKNIKIQIVQEQTPNCNSPGTTAQKICDKIVDLDIHDTEMKLSK